MIDLLNIQKVLIPQVIELMERRYSILRQISLSEPIGRRTLSNTLEISERIIRSETEFLKQQELIDVAVSGMTITDKGTELLESLKEIMNDVMGLSTLQDKVKDKLGIKKVLLVPGSCDKNQSLLRDVARCSSEYFLDILKDGDIVSITGGSSMLEFANSIKTDKKYSSTSVVPARGSMGVEVETQSNNIVASIAKRLNSKYKLLHIPDELGEEAKKTLTQEPEIKEVLDKIKDTDILIFGIGNADTMAKRRKLSQSTIEEIISKGAVGEAFGHYFNEDGEIVHNLNTVGINLDTFKSVREPIAVFAGEEKAKALVAVSKINKNITVVTDEKTAHKILDII